VRNGSIKHRCPVVSLDVIRDVDSLVAQRTALVAEIPNHSVGPQRDMLSDTAATTRELPENCGLSLHGGLLLSLHGESHLTRVEELLPIHIERTLL